MIAGLRVPTRRSVVLTIILGFALGTIIVAMRRLADICPAGSYCHGLSTLHEKLPSFRKQNPDMRPQHGLGSSRTKHRACENFPDTSSMLLVMKTGASETFAKIPTQVMTNLRCLPEYFIFSDMEQNVAGYQIHDSLESVLPEVKTGNKDFELYFRQKQCPVHKEECNKNHDAAAEGWALDKYKNIHIAEKTFKMRPNYDWYVFVDADTYIVWPTMVEWMKRLDPSDRHYLGSVTYLGDFPFGHGGSGYVVSRTAMQDFFEGKEKVANRWDNRASHECCGDYLFGLALKTETNIAVNNTWPTINGEKPNTIWYGEGQWCHPMATMHHIGSEEISMFDEYEQGRKYSGPVLIKDVYHHFVEPYLKDYRQDWDNMSDDTWYLDTTPGKHEEEQIKKAKTEGLTEQEQKAHLSVEDCRKACQSQDDCLQWRFHKGICGTSRVIKHGYPTKPEEDAAERRVSGWDLEKVHAWVRKNDECPEIRWPVVGKANDG